MPQTFIFHISCICTHKFCLQIHLNVNESFSIKLETCPEYILQAHFYRVGYKGWFPNHNRILSNSIGVGSMSALSYLDTEDYTQVTNSPPTDVISKTS